MKKSKFPLILLLSFLVLGVSFISTNNPLVRTKPILIFPKGSTYELEWKKADSLIAKGLNRSAYKVVEGIYEKAKEDINSQQVAKAIIYRIRLESNYEEEAYVKSIYDLQSEIEDSYYPLTPVLHSITASVYWSYFQRYRWRYYNRTITQGFDNTDIRTWDLKRIVRETMKHHELALANEDELRRTPITTFDDILVRENDETRKLRPTLYDFLAHRSLDFFMSSESFLTQPSYAFEMRDSAYFGLAGEFARLEVNSKDSMSMKLRAVKILQGLTEFHLNDQDKEALLEIELKRLMFMKQQVNVPGRDALYLAALRKRYDAHKDKAFGMRVAFAIATYYDQRANSYSPLQSDDNKWDRKKAVALCDSAIAAFPKSNGALNCKYLKSLISQKSYSITNDDAAIPDVPIKALVNFRNVGKLYFRLCEVDYEKHRKLIYRKYGKELMKILVKLPVSQEWDQTLDFDGDFQNHSVEIKIPEAGKGHYVLMAASDPSFSTDKEAIAYSNMWISNISYLSRSKPDGTYDFTVLHRKTGEPMPGVKATILQEKYNYILREYEFKRIGSYTTDQNGFFKVNVPTEYRNFYVDFTKGDDQLSTHSNFYQSRPYHPPKIVKRVHLFTDRSIYRPGQTVHFKGIMIKTEGEKNRILTNFTSTIYLYDVNYQVVSEQKLTTNEYGTYSGTFVTPTGSLNGQMRIGNTYGSAYISVEEYKRPKFEVKSNPVKGSFKLNEVVKVDGQAKAYAGSTVDGAQVKYRVVRNANFPYWCYYWRGYWPTSPQMEIEHGELLTDESGKYEIEFTAIPDNSISRDLSPTYTYTVYVDVVDINGETHSTQHYVRIGYTSLNLSINIPEKLSVNSLDTFKISTTNLAGETTPAPGSISIHRLKAPSKIFRNRKWSRPDLYSFTKEQHDQLFPHDIYNEENDKYKWEKGERVFNIDFDTEKSDDLLLRGSSTWKPGHYVIEAKATDKDGVEVKYVSYITVFDEKSTKAPVNEYAWFHALNVNAEPGDTIQFLVASGAGNVVVRYEVEHKDKIISKEWITLTGDQKMIRVPVLEIHRGNFTLHFSIVKDNRSYTFDQLIYVPYSNKKLDIEFETFRNKLLPGQMEEWKVKIKGHKGEKVAAEMLAAMYDASLDAFRSHHWNFNIYQSYYSRLNWSSYLSFGSRSTTLYQESWNIYEPYHNRIYDYLNWFGLYDYSRYYGRGGAAYWYDSNRMDYASRTVNGSFHLTDESVVSEDLEMESSIEEIAMPMSAAQNKSKDNMAMGGDVADAFKMRTKNDRSGLKKGEAEGKSAGYDRANLSNVKARSDFSESAFFFPHLSTNDKGEVIIKFTVPESLTRWKFMGFAHTKDLEFGQLFEEVVTQKELMVMPNAPRFFREGDQMTFSAKVSNLSEKKLKGTAQLFFFDAITMKPVDEEFLRSNDQQSFDVEPGRSTVVSWNIAIPEGMQAVTYKVVAQAGKFTDGEEMAIPVLTNRMLVTESMPLPIRGNETKEFRFEKLISSGGSSTMKHHRLTLEFTSNPAWYAVQALPYMMEYPYACSEQVFSRYYANSLATFIANSSPKIKAVFDSWKSSSPEAFLSNLEKNQELKSLILKETPWVLDAQNESERKKRIGLLFDMNRMSNELGRALKKLIKAQSANGGWPWFKGMEESRYITQHIVTGFGHLDHLGVENVHGDAKVWNMVKKGVLYLDNRIREDYEWLVKHKVNLEENHLGSIQIQYLYARSYFKDIPIANRNKKAFEYYKGQAKKYWLENNRYMQGMIALALHREEVKVIPGEIMNSLRENSIHSEEMGMYWKDNYEGFYWYQAPIESQALLIEAFDEVADDQKSVEELKIWLLKSKQTQDWKTTKATAEACYALLLKGTNLLASDALVSVQIGDMVIDPKTMDDVKVEAGTGYFKTSWSKTEIKPEWGKVKVTKDDEGVAWGALYWQYFEQLDKITPHETPLKLQKALFLEIPTDDGVAMKPITSKTKLKPGDKIKVRIELRVDRDMEFVHMKDMRASAFEPINVISRYKWQDGLGYYESTGDAATNFFFDRLPKGTYVFEYPLRVSHSGDFSNGISSIQCMYAPEFTAHSEGIRVKVGK
ncbi:alpha-2-macroglobulin [Flavobacteriales bacterium AH-315-E23]|nr:alpha-2-macroglobulin [Flavobacteriales bacterium AH-315-E23]